MAVLAAIDMETGRIEMRARGRQPQTRGCRGSNEAVECRHPRVVERIEGTPEGVIIEMAGLHTRGNQARDRFMLEKMRDEVQLLVEKAQPVEHHGFAGMAGGHNPHCRVLLRRLINNLRDAEFCKHSRNETQVISDLCAVRVRLGRDDRAVRVSHRLLLCRGIVAAPKNYSMTHTWCGIAGLSQFRHTSHEFAPASTGSRSSQRRGLSQGVAAMHTGDGRWADQSCVAAARGALLSRAAVAAATDSLSPWARGCGWWYRAEVCSDEAKSSE